MNPIQKINGGLTQNSATEFNNFNVLILLLKILAPPPTSCKYKTKTLKLLSHTIFNYLNFSDFLNEFKEQK